MGGGDIELENLVRIAKDNGVPPESILSVLLNASPTEVLLRIKDRAKAEQGVSDSDFDSFMAPED